MGKSTWSAEMDRRLQQMRDDPNAYAADARRRAQKSRITLVGVQKGSKREKPSSGKPRWA